MPTIEYLRSLVSDERGLKFAMLNYFQHLEDRLAALEARFVAGENAKEPASETEA